MADLPEHIIRIADLPNGVVTTFDLAPDDAARTAIAHALDVPGIRKLKFSGQLEPFGEKDWRLTAELGTTVIQTCVVTLDPVTTRIDERVERIYLTNLPDIDDEEIEMPDDDTTEALPASLDVAAVMIEAVALSLPPYPRADHADIGEAVFTEPGKKPMRDEDARPFAGLAGLRDQLSKDTDSDT